MGFNLDNLRNIEPPLVNTSRIGTGADVPENIVLYTRDAAVNVWINSVAFAAYIVLVWWFIEKKGYNYYQASLLASTFNFTIIAALLLSGWSKNLYPLILYGTISMVSAMAVYINKKKGFN